MTTKTTTIGMKTETCVKDGGLPIANNTQHGMVIRSKVKAGGWGNHNQVAASR